MPRVRSFLEYLELPVTDRVPGSPPESIPSGLTSSPNFPKPLNVSFADLSDPRVIDDINNHLEVKLSDGLLTPYIGLERARKVLHPYGIIIPAVAWLNGDDGYKVFPVSQWGGLFGASPGGDIDVNLKTNPELQVYLSWSYDDKKDSYDLYCAVVNAEELDDLLKTDFDGTSFDDQNDVEDALAAVTEETQHSSQ